MSVIEAPWRAARVLGRLPCPAATRSGAVHSTTRWVSGLRLWAASPSLNGIPTGATKGDSYVAELVRMLEVADRRDEALDALWRHSEGGKENVDEIVCSPLCFSQMVSLIASDNLDTTEAATGLLRQISAVQPYGLPVAQAGALEAIAGLLTQQDVPPLEVRDQAANLLLNLSAVPELRDRIANSELLSTVVCMLESEEQVEQIAAAGTIAKLSLSECTHALLLLAGVIPKLAKVLMGDIQKVSKIARQEARSALLRFSKSPEAKLAAIQEGLVFVPLVGADAYKSLKVDGGGSPKIFEDVKLDHSLGSQESPFGAGDLLLGLHIGSEQQSIDEATQLAVEGRSRLNFLKRVGLIESDASAVTSTSKKCEAERLTVLPWWDAIPRLVLILGLEDVSYALQGAQALADVAVTDDLRQKLARAGAIPHLVYLLGSGDERAIEAAALAIDKLSLSQKVRRAINSFSAIPALVEVLKTAGIAESLQEKIVGALVSLSQTQEQLEAVVRSGNATGVLDIVNAEDATADAKAEAESVFKEIMSLKADPRDKIVDAGGVPPLVKLLSAGSVALKHKAAIVLQKVATKEAHAVTIVEAGVDVALRSALDVETETTQGGDGWHVVSAFCQLLEKLLDSDGARGKLDCPSYTSLLPKIVACSGAPLHIKEWTSRCLLKLMSPDYGTMV